MGAGFWRGVRDVRRQGLLLMRPAPRRPLYYGWPMLVGVSLAQVVSWGILYYAFSVFIAPMEAELRWPRVALTGAYAIALLCAGLAAVPVGRWLDARGPRGLMTLGSLLGPLLLIAWSQVASLWAFYLIMAAVGAVSAAVLYEPAFAIVAVWFRRQRGRALTVLTFFGAWASFLFIPLAGWLVATVGWRQALLVLAGVLAAVTLPIHALLLRRRPQDLGLHPDGAAGEADAGGAAAAEQSASAGAALRDAGFWWLTLAFGASTVATISNTVYLIPFLIEQGQSPTFAAQVAGLFGLMSLLGRLVIGPLGDRLPRRAVTAGLLATQAGALALLAAAPTAAGALVFIALFGAGSGTLTIMRAALLAERYGAANYGSISGAQNAALTAARTLAPIGAGLVAGLPGGYRTTLAALAALVCVGFVAVLLARDNVAAAAPVAGSGAA
jgi:MFS family permease